MASRFKAIGGIVLAVGSFFVLVASMEETGGDTSSNDGTSSAGGAGVAADVDISSCQADSMGQLEAVLTVTNSSSKPSDYFIEVVFESKDGSTQLDSTFASVENLAPGQRAETTALSFKDAPADFTCRVIDVNRMASI